MTQNDKSNTKTESIWEIKDEGIDNYLLHQSAKFHYLQWELIVSKEINDDSLLMSSLPLGWMKHMSCPEAPRRIPPGANRTPEDEYKCNKSMSKKIMISYTIIIKWPPCWVKCETAMGRSSTHKPIRFPETKNLSVFEKKEEVISLTNVV